MEENKLANNNLIYKIRTGSFMYGTNIEGSDNDYLGIFVPDKDYYLGLKKVEQVILSEKISKGSRNMQGDMDYTCYSVDKFIKLAMGCNPNIIEMLFVPTSHIININEYGYALRRIRDKFLSKKAYHTFKGFCFSELQKIQKNYLYLVQIQKEMKKRNLC
jgi:predicted nucleotidyltransferase